MPHYDHVKPFYIGEGEEKRTLLMIICQDETEKLFREAASLVTSYVSAKKLSEGADKDVEAKLSEDPGGAYYMQVYQPGYLSLTAVGGPHDGIQALGLGSTEERCKAAAQLALAA